MLTVDRKPRTLLHNIVCDQHQVAMGRLEVGRVSADAVGILSRAS